MPLSQADFGCFRACFCFLSRGPDPLRGGGRAPTDPEIKNARPRRAPSATLGLQCHPSGTPPRDTYLDMHQKGDRESGRTPPRDRRTKRRAFVEVKRLQANEYYETQCNADASMRHMLPGQHLSSIQRYSARISARKTKTLSARGQSFRKLTGIARRISCFRKC